MCQQVPKSRRLTYCAVKLRRIIIRSHDSSPSGDVIFGDHGITTALIFLPCLYNATSACLYYIHCATLRLCISPLLYMHPVPRPWPSLHMSSPRGDPYQVRKEPGSHPHTSGIENMREVKQRMVLFEVQS
jgi:hypothetical protein